MSKYNVLMNINGQKMEETWEAEKAGCNTTSHDLEGYDTEGKTIWTVANGFWVYCVKVVKEG